MNNIKTPWYKYYDGVKEHIDYPKITVYGLLEKSSSKRLDYISYNYQDDGGYYGKNNPKYFIIGICCQF